MRPVWKISRLAVCAGAIVAASAPMAVAAPTRLAANTNLRMGPGTNFGVIATAPRGAVVDVVRCSALWCNVLWRGRPGYMIARNLSARPAGPAVAVAPLPPPVLVGPPVVVGPPVYGPYYYGPGPYYWGPRVYFGPRPWRRWGW
jgi:uncharacterized protein YraI